MKQLTWLAAERRLCADGDSEEDHSPTSEEEEDESCHKGAGEGRSRKGTGDDEMPSGDGTPQESGGRCPGRGRGQRFFHLRFTPQFGLQYFIPSGTNGC